MFTHRTWEWVDGIVAKLTVSQTAAIGGTGSLASAGSAFTIDAFASGVQLFTVIGGAVGVILSVGLMGLKIVQQRREMQAFIETGKREMERTRAAAATASTAAATAAVAASVTARQAVKSTAQVEEQKDLQNRVATLEAEIQKEPK